MRQTGLTFEKDIYNLVKESVLKTAIKGSFYREGMRPLNAKTEDAVVSFMTGVDDQIQIGVVNVNVYVPDIDAGKMFLGILQGCTKRIDPYTAHPVAGKAFQDQRIILRSDNRFQTK